MKEINVIFAEGDHTWAVVARDPEKADYLIDTNEYLITSNNEIILADPGGMEIFPVVFSAICREYNPSQIKALFASHQDPDIISSLSLWLSINRDIKCYTSWLWAGFIPHFGGQKETFIQIPDPGMDIKLGNITLQAFPAHHLHSAGNFHLYDPKAKMYFSGDLGAALLPPNTGAMFVEDFDEHIQYMKGFHQRWMGSREAKDRWCNAVQGLKIDMLCPQHGSIFRGKDVERFVNWFADLEVGKYSQ